MRIFVWINLACAVQWGLYAISEKGLEIIMCGACVLIAGLLFETSRKESK